MRAVFDAAFAKLLWPLVTAAACVSFVHWLLYKISDCISIIHTFKHVMNLVALVLHILCPLTGKALAVVVPQNCASPVMYQSLGLMIVCCLEV